MSQDKVFGCSIFAVIGVVILVIVLVIGNSFGGYILQPVGATEIGILTRPRTSAANEPDNSIEILGPGIYTNPFDMGADIRTVSTNGISFTVTDTEVALAGGQENIQQTIGLTVTGVIYKPGLVDRISTSINQDCVAKAATPEEKAKCEITTTVSKMTPKLWRDNNAFYIDDNLLLGKIAELTKQAMKVCVGPLKLAQAAVGQDRNDVADCVDEQLTKLALPLAIDVSGVVVPEVILPDAVRGAIDSLAAQDAQVNAAVKQSTVVFEEGRQREAEVRANINVTQAAQQANIQITQQAIEAQSTVAAAQQTQIAAESAVINAQATQDGQILLNQKQQAQVQLDIALLKAQSDTANVTMMARLYQENPEYVAYLVQVAYAEGLKAVEKVFYIPADTRTINFLNGQMQNQAGQPITPLVDLNTPAILPTPSPVGQ